MYGKTGFFSRPAAFDGMKLRLAGAAALLFFLGAPAALVAGDMVLNSGFEMESTHLWTETGNVPSWHRGVAEFDVTGNGRKSWTYYQHPGSEISGGLDQIVTIRANETYVVSADICYHNG